MADKFTESELRELTNGDETTAVAECIEGLGCSVYAGGKELPPWASNKVEELVGIYVRDKAVITSSTDPDYFILKLDDSRDDFTVLRGPLNAHDLAARLKP
jgi:hypothetical protein